MTTEANLEKHAVSISSQAHNLARLAEKGDAVRAEMEQLCSRLGLLTQEYFVIGEAMKVTLEEMAGKPIPPCPTYNFNTPRMFGWE